MQHDLDLPLMLGRGGALLSHRERAGVRGYGFSEVRTPSPGGVGTMLRVAVSADLSPLGRQLWVPCGWDGVKADHLPPSHRRAAASALARSSGLRSARASSSMGSPLPAVFATRCHLRPSTLSIGAPCPLTSTRARRFWAIGLFCLAALRNSATAAASFFGVPVPL